MKTSLFFVFLFLLFSGVALAAEFSQTELQTEYRQLIQQSQDVSLKTRDDLAILPRLALIEKYLQRADWEQARLLIEECRADFAILASNDYFENAAKKKSDIFWPQTFFDLFRWYAVLAILAFGFVRLPWFREKESDFWRWRRPAVTTFLCGVLAVIFVLFDQARFQQEIWNYFNIQVVMLTLAASFGSWIIFAIVFALHMVWTHVIQVPAHNEIALLVTILINCATAWTLRKTKWAIKNLIICTVSFGFFALMITYVWRDWNYWNIWSFLFLIFSHVGAVFIFWGFIHFLINSEKKEIAARRLVETELQLLKAQIKPHFLFNTLGSIAAVSSREKAPQTRGLIESLANYFRYALEAGREKVALRYEIDFLRKYLEIEKVRFEEILLVEWDIKLSESTLDILFPVLVLQTLAENAIQHGIRPKLVPGVLSIKAYEDEKVVYFQIADNGVGQKPGFFEQLNQGQGPAPKGFGIGVKNIMKRLQMCFQEKVKISFETGLGQGMKVSIQIIK